MILRASPPALPRMLSRGPDRINGINRICFGPRLLPIRLIVFMPSKFSFVPFASIRLCRIPPQRQLSVLTLLHRLLYHHSQLIIATHSPILLAYPNARIYLFSKSVISEIKYTETEHYQITKDFLNRHERRHDRKVAGPARLSKERRDSVFPWAGIRA